MARKKQKRKSSRALSPIQGLQSDMLGFGKMAITGGVTAATAGGVIAAGGPAAAAALPMMGGFATIGQFAGPVALASGGKRALDAVKGLSVEPRKSKKKKWRY